ncbi:polysaccharide biosynthesis tyrosine autokinase [Ginsengibacter hankyongi]|uniref:Polysaccharide biosynthesis tyrosine autokinase n=1 Tax=Ginsengibacter hankyongi TaxID=2607284 RepID=A0A5J5INA7_9BACT|nr:tyrosine-protein kinase [Ginsengibacter hankyongi]KAA9041477.1 polysaccharide biosynthesis tyrosine autokinase [Ginsengibacter hankyongi]
MQQLVNMNEPDESEGLSLGDVFYKFLPYWPLFALLVAIGMTSAWLYLRYKRPVYQTTAVLLIKDDKNTSANTDLIDALDMFGSKKNVENEVEVLQSKTLMQEVVKNLHLYAPITIEGRVTNQSGYESCPIVIEAKDPDSIKVAQKIPFSYNEALQSIHIGKNDFPLNRWVSTSFGVLEFLPNKYYHFTGKIDEPNDFYFSLLRVKNTANSILGSITISASSKESSVINLSIKGEDPKRGEDILNELLQVYNEAAILDKNMLAANTLKFVEDRLKFVSNDLDSVERQLQSFKARNKITDISAQGQIFLQTVATNDQKISDLNMQLAVLDQVENYVKSKEGMGGIVPATLGVADPSLTNLIQKLSDLELQYSQTKKIVPDNNPSIIALLDAINKLKPGILENINSQRTNLLAARDDLSSTNSSYTSMLKTIPEKERELLGISRQQAIKNNIYTFLLQKREETTLSYASAVADSRVIDKAETSDVPVSPKKSLIYFIVFVGSLAFGIAAISIKTMLTRSIQDRAEIEKYTDIPFLGEVNYDRSKSAIVIAEGKRSFIAEQFRQLRTSLGYMGIDETHKRILITSSISGEGKSFIAINLGISLALMGKKVALLELDLRKPKLSEQFGISRHVGLSNYLIGKLPVENLMKSTGIDNLFLAPAGPIPPNPSELISNGKLQELLSYLGETLDYIIMDTAPINPVTDAFIISPLADVTLFIIRHDYTPKMFLKKLEQQHKKDALKNPAIVYNGIRGKGVNKYGYGYGYGYTEEENETSWLKKIFRR